MSIVEMMVGLAVGLIVTAAAMTMMLAQLREARRLSAETQLQQDVRAVSELITRQLRKAGFWALPEDAIWSSGSATRATLNPYSTIQFPGTSYPAAGVNFWISRHRRDLAHNLPAALLDEDGVASTSEQRGFRLVSGVIQYFDGNAWQPLTTSSSMTVGALNFTPVVQCQPTDEFEASVCTAGSSTCPRQASTVRIDFSIAATATADSSVSRTSSGSVVLRNASTWGCPGS